MARLDADAASPRLRVALVHDATGHTRPAGPDLVADQARALEGAGHTVFLVPLTDRPRRTGPLNAAAGRGPSASAELHRLRPDVTHVHNLLSAGSRYWARTWEGPLVAAVYGYRPVCAAAAGCREGAVCAVCCDAVRGAGPRYRTSRGPLPVRSAPTTARRRAVTAVPLLARADRVTVTSMADRELYLRAGLPAHRLALVPPFVSRSATPAVAGPPGTRWGYVGELTAESGALELLRQWPSGEALDVIGDGDLMEACRRAAPRRVRFLGRCPDEEVRRHLPSWAGLAVPGRCADEEPPVYPDALAAGVPVLAWPGAALADAVRSQGTGRVVSPGEPLEAALAAIRADLPHLRRRCRAVYQREYGVQRWTERMLTVYQEAVLHRMSGRTTNHR